MTGCELEQPPEMKKDPTKTVFKAFIKVRCLNIDIYKEVCERLRYFMIDDKECRALAHDENFKVNNPTPFESQIYVKNIPKKMK